MTELIVANPRPAATVVVLRDSSSGPEVFMVRRHADTAFMGGAHVFPGGRVEKADRDGGEAWCDGIAHAARQLPDLPSWEAVVYHVAATRELFEEAGVLLGRSADGEFVSLAGESDHARFKQDRAAVHRGKTTLRSLIERERLRLALDALVLFAHWVTPPIDTRQFDTRFFMTRVPPHQTPAHDETETTHSIWMTPADAIEQSQRGEIVLPPPTWSTIRELEPFASVDEALGWARRRRVVSRQPLLLEQDGLRMLLAPGDPLHPDPAGDEPLAETRFVFVDGRSAPGACRVTATPNIPTTRQLRRVLTFRDLVLYYSVTGFSLRWIATAAAAGPSALVIWIVAALGFFVPLVFSTLELSSRYPQEGGIYVWSKRAFGPFAAFITGWTYWGSNLPYFPGLLYFAAANALFIGGEAWQPLATNSMYFVVVAMTGLTIAVTMNVVGLNVGKWLNNVGAIASWIVAALLIALAAVAWGRFGSATPIEAGALVPSTSLKDVIFWSTIAFAFGGVESGSTMGEEIHDARRTVPRAILTAGALITVLYLAGTLSVLVTIPREQVSGLQGIMQAMQTVTANVGLPWLAPIVAALVTVNALGGVGGWFAATARLPFVAGIDRFLPPAFGELHPRWRTPYVALLVQAAIAGLFVFLGQAGTTVRGVYNALVSMGIIAYFIPFLFMFAAMIVLQREPAGPDVIRVPGGKPVAIALAATGFIVTAVSIVLACIPPDEEPNKMLEIVRVVGLSLVLVGIGVVVYLLGRHRARSG